MGAVTRWIDRTCYPDHAANWDDSLFRRRILAHIRRNSVVLDIGAGAGIVEQMNVRGLARRVCGVDLDPRVVDNPMLDEGRIADAARVPFEDGSFDVVFSNNVLEHLDEPDRMFREVARLLKPGGVFLFKTPNRWHYVPTIARLTPHGFHQFAARLRGRAAVDTFPTHYRANTRSDVVRLAEQAGLAVERIELTEARPEYLRVAWPAYLLGLAYERLVNSTALLSPLRVILIGTLRK